MNRSKKLSEPKPSRPPNPSEPVVFIDRSCGGKKIPEAFREIGFQVVVQNERFADDADDVEILEACGRSAWIYVTQDFAIRRNPAELRALASAQIHAIFLAGRKRPAEWVIANLRAAARRLVAKLREAKTPLHIVVKAGGRIETLTPLDQKPKAAKK